MTVIPRRPKVLERRVTVGSEAKSACVRQSAAARLPAGHDGLETANLLGFARSTQVANAASQLDFR